MQLIRREEEIGIFEPKPTKIFDYHNNLRINKLKTFSRS